MLQLFRTRATLIWLLLVAATAASWALGHGAGFHALRDASVGIIVVAFIKVRFVMLDFMELRRAPVPMRIAAEVWVAAICAALIVLYLLGEPNV